MVYRICFLPLLASLTVTWLPPEVWVIVFFANKYLRMQIRKQDWAILLLWMQLLQIMKLKTGHQMSFFGTRFQGFQHAFFWEPWKHRSFLTNKIFENIVTERDTFFEKYWSVRTALLSADIMTMRRGKVVAKADEFFDEFSTFPRPRFL